jgi:asparagine synthase (glutamine-hydrolysing)
MRGIAGIIRFDQAPVARTEIDGMLHTMAICPTDRIESCEVGSAGFGHLSKYIVAEDRFDAQPLRSSDGNLLLVADAMLDNRDELAAAFGWRPDETSTRADSAFVLAARERWGDQCPSHLEGRFALVVWQIREQRLFAAVDHFGFRPLYYWHNAKELVFATTLKGLFALRRVPREISEQVFAEHVAGLKSEPSATLYRDVRRLVAGHQLHGTPSSFTSRRYWNPDPARLLRLPSDLDYLEAFRAELERAVRTSLRRHRGNVAIMLSGGLDSAAVTAVAGRLLAGQGQRLQAIHTVPAGTDRYRSPLREIDESRFVHSMRAHSPHIDFHFVPAQSEAVPPDRWDSAFDNEFVPFRSLPAHEGSSLGQLLDALDVGVLLNGLGGNDLVSVQTATSGYLTHLFAAGRWPTWWRELRGHGRVYGPPLWLLFRHSALHPLKRWLRPNPPIPAHHNLFLLHPALRARTNIESRLREQEQAAAALPFNFRRQLHRTLTEELIRQSGVTGSIIKPGAITRLGAAPLCDRRLNEFCLSLPFDQQIRDGWDRRLLRESMRGPLPDDVRLRVTRGFPQPQFQRNFSRIEPALREALGHQPRGTLAGAYLDLPRLRSWWDHGNAQPSMSAELALVRGIALSRFLQWHERQTTSLP